MITTLLLDAGGTLVFPNFGRIADEFGRDGVRADPDALARAEAHVRRFIDDPAVFGRFRHETDEERWYRYIEKLGEFCALGGVPRGAVARLKTYHDQHNLWEHVPADVPAALDALAKRFRLGVVSNANGTVREKFRRLGLAGRFEVIIDSAEEGVEKPDPRLFLIALDRMGARTRETAYVGDLYHVDVLGAQAAGLEAFLLDPHGLHADRPCRRIAVLTDIIGLL